MKRASQGFTLIELLVVMVILGVLAGAVALSVGNRGQDAQIKENSQRLFGLIQILADEAIFEGKELGVFFTENTYEFYFFQHPENTGQKGSWQKYTSPPFKSHELPEELRLELAIDDESIDLTPLLEEGEEKTIPQMIFWASGDSNPFKLILIDEDQQIPAQIISANGAGELELNKESEDDF